MSVKKYLTLNGLAYFLNKIKSTMADELDGKANDSEVLHKAQTETVTGEKTFKKDVKIIDLNANERPGVKFEVNGSFRTFEQAKDSLPDPDFGDFGGGTLWDGGFLADNTKIQNSMGDYVINDITFGTANYSSVIEFNNYYKVTYEDGHHSPEDVTGMLRFELAPYENVEKDHEYWSDPDLYLYAMLDGGFSGGSTILGNPRAPWSKAYIGEINCEDIKFGFGMFSIFDVLGNIRNLSYVTHYSSTALTPSSTNSNTLLDNTDNLKVGDKVIDSSGVLFSITAIDTQNSTFTIGSALVDLALDANVVHKSGNETVGGVKTFTDSQNLTGYTAIRIYSPIDEVGVLPSTSQVREIKFTDKNNVPISYFAFQHRASSAEPFRTCWRQQKVDGTSSYYSVNFNNLGEFYPENNNPIKLGTSTNRWAEVYAQSYYYGSNNVEFSTKFVTTDTIQVVDGIKQLNAYLTLNGSQMNNEFSNNARTCAYLTANRDTVGKSGVFVSKFRQNRAQGAMSGNDVVQLTFDVYENEVRTNRLWYLNWLDWNNDVPETVEIRSMCNKVDYKLTHINNLEPSALGMPDLSNGVDISSYITVNGGNKESLYTPPSNGWISVALTRTGGVNMAVMLKQGSFASSGHNIQQENGTTTCNAMLPVKGGVQVSINSALADGIAFAYFYPCQGNV